MLRTMEERPIPDDPRHGAEIRTPGTRILFRGILVTVTVSLALGLLLRPRWLDPAYLADRHSFYKTRFFEQREFYEGIELCGSTWFREHVKEGLSIAKRFDPGKLREIQAWIGCIQQSDQPAILVGEDPPTVLLSHRQMTFSTTPQKMLFSFAVESLPDMANSVRFGVR